MNVPQNAQLLLLHITCEWLHATRL